MVCFFVFLLNKTSWAYLLGSGLKLIFHWQANLLIFTKLFSNSFAVAFALWTTENNEVSSANNFPLDDRLAARSFICIKNGSYRNFCVNISTRRSLPVKYFSLLSISVNKLVIDLEGYQICHSIVLYFIESLRCTYKRQNLHQMIGIFRE